MLFVQPPVSMKIIARPVCTHRTENRTVTRKQHQSANMVFDPLAKNTRCQCSNMQITKERVFGICCAFMDLKFARLYCHFVLHVCI